MEFRSTNVAGYVHYQGDVVSNVSGSSHGVHLRGGSTGGIVMPAGDEANIALNVVGKGTGAVNVVNSSSPVLLAGSSASVSALSVSLIQFTILALTTSGIAPVESTIAFAGMTTNAAYVVSRRAPYN